ncbi:MAG: hypothetical protein AAF573_10200 [Bacteroidota bacterium]
MKNLKFPVTQHDLAKISKVPINGQILIDRLENIGFNAALFLDYLRKHFSLLDQEKINVTHFFLRKRANKFYLNRAMVDTTEMSADSDFPMISNATEVPDALVENHWMGSLLFRIFHWAIKDDLELALKISVQFQRLTPPTPLHQLEGFHSFIIVDRKNIKGGHSTMSDHSGAKIIDRTFEPGAFIFQMKKNDHNNASPSLLHEMTSLEKKDSNSLESWLDMMSFRLEMATRSQ